MKSLVTIIKVPYWILSPLTQAKSFKGNPIIGSKTLNTLGLHVARILLSRLSFSLRQFLLSPMMTRESRREYKRNGFVLFENFLSKEDVIAIRADIHAYKGEARQLTQGDTATQRFLLDETTLNTSPHLRKTAMNKLLWRYLNYTGGKIAAPLLYIQRIRNGGQPGGADPQKNIHSDTFHPTMKAWLFLEDVTEEMGPFTYVPTSQRLTRKRLRWEYRRSVNAATMDDKYSEKGSMRATTEDLKKMSLPSPRGITAKAGTLVIANTNGFHGRGQATAGSSRLELWAYSRHNPFNPFPGIPMPFARILKNTAMKLFWTRADKKAAAKNSKASWHLIPAKDMLDDLTP